MLDWLILLKKLIQLWKRLKRYVESDEKLTRFPFSKLRKTYLLPFKSAAIYRMHKSSYIWSNLILSKWLIVNFFCCDASNMAENRVLIFNPFHISHLQSFENPTHYQLNPFKFTDNVFKVLFYMPSSLYANQ